jgi:octaprenyl-diphosphate synthase
MTLTFNNYITQAKILLNKEMQEVNSMIVEKMQNDVALIPAIAQNIINSGGKRIRPILTLLTANMLGYAGTNHLLIASCIEFIHTATLLHDDVVDENNERRGIETSNSIFGNQSCVLVGDYLFSKAFELMVDTGSLEILKVLSKASSVIAEGEVMQLSNINNVSLSEEDYFKIIFSKTASLFSASTRVGGMLSTNNEATIQELENYGVNLGIAFQIIDDYLDYASDSKNTGKNIGVDFKEGKITLPILLTLQVCSNEDRLFFIRTFEQHNQNEQDFAECLKYLHKYDSLNKSLIKANEYLNKAVNNINAININNDYATMLKNLALSSLTRLG